MLLALHPYRSMQPVLILEHACCGSVRSLIATVLAMQSLHA